MSSEVFVIGPIGSDNAPGNNFLELPNMQIELHLDNLNRQIMAFGIFDRLEGCPKDYRGEWIKHYLADDQPETKATESEWRQVLSDAGFSTCEIIERVLLDAVLWARKTS